MCVCICVSVCMYVMCACVCVCTSVCAHRTEVGTENSSLSPSACSFETVQSLPEPRACVISAILEDNILVIPGAGIILTCYNVLGSKVLVLMTTQQPLLNTEPSHGSSSLISTHLPSESLEGEFCLD